MSIPISLDFSSFELPGRNLFSRSNQRDEEGSEGKKDDLPVGLGRDKSLRCQSGSLSGGDDFFWEMAGFF